MIAWFREGGWTMWAALAAAMGVGLLEFVAFVLAATAVATGKAIGTARGVALLAILATTVPLGIGAAGWWYGRSTVDSVLTLVDPEQVEVIREEGYREARHPMELGGGAACVLAGFGTAALAVSLVARPKGAEAT